MLAVGMGLIAVTAWASLPDNGMGLIAVTAWDWLPYDGMGRTTRRRSPRMAGPGSAPVTTLHGQALHDYTDFLSHRPHPTHAR